MVIGILFFILLPFVTLASQGDFSSSDVKIEYSQNRDLGSSYADTIFYTVRNDTLVALKKGAGIEKSSYGFVKELFIIDTIKNVSKGFIINPARSDSFSFVYEDNPLVLKSYEETDEYYNGEKMSLLVVTNLSDASGVVINFTRHIYYVEGKFCYLSKKNRSKINYFGTPNSELPVKILKFAGDGNGVAAQSILHLENIEFYVDDRGSILD